MNIKQSYLDRHPCYQAGKKIMVKGLMLHSVGCPQPSAESFVKQWNSPAAARACVHGFIDGNTGDVYQTLPWEYRAWHCGGEANNTHIGVEMCEPSCICYTGGAVFNCSNPDAAREVVNRTYQSAVELFAFLCIRFGLNTLQDGIIISHKEGHDRGVASGHSDPEHIWNQLNAGYTMDTFRLAVDHAMREGENPREAAPAAPEPSDNTSFGISSAGIQLIAKYEGCRLEAYKCPAGVWTIGYGHTQDVQSGQKITQQQAISMLQSDARKYADYVNTYKKNGIISFSLNQNQFDALASFTYNCGPGNLKNLVSGRSAMEVADKLPAYNRGGGKVLEGLSRRRKEERDLFLKGC